MAAYTSRTSEGVVSPYSAMGIKATERKATPRTRRALGVPRKLNQVSNLCMLAPRICLSFGRLNNLTSPTLAPRKALWL